MKVFKLFSVALMLAMAVGVVGCGQNDDATTNPALNNPSYNAGVINPPNGALPVGSYPNGYGQYLPCPIGYTQNGNYCYQNITGNGSNNGGYTGGAFCPQNTFFNGYNCQPIGVYGCPQGFSWSNYYYQCVGANYPTANYPNNCKVYKSGIFYSYICY